MREILFRSTNKHVQAQLDCFGFGMPVFIINMNLSAFYEKH